MKLFQYAGIFNPTKEETKEGKKASLIIPITSVMCESEQVASMKAVREIPEEYLEKLGQIDILVRPF